MFGREIALNRFQLGYFEKIVADIPAESFAQRGAGGGHPPVWIVGHLAIVGETATRLVGGEEPTHPEWLPLFGPRSSDEVPDAERFGKQELVEALHVAYAQLHSQAAGMTDELASRPHALALLKGTPIESNGDLLAHVLTSHFALHLGQLSCWRRAAGHEPLF